MMADMVDDDLGRGSSAWLTRALAVQKQHQTPPEIDFTPPVFGPQRTIIGDYIAGGGLHNVTARSTNSIKSLTKRPRSEKSGAADNYCFIFFYDRPGECHRQNCKVTDRSMQFLQGHDGLFERMLDTLKILLIPRVDAEQVRRWFGEVKKFSNIDLLVQIVSEGAPVAVTEKEI